MDWLIFALAGTAFFSAAGVLDKLLLSSYARDSKAYIVCQVIVQQLFTLPILMKIGIDFVYPESVIAMAVGALQFLPSIFFMRAVQMEEASRVAAMEYFYPVFVFLGAFLFLGESLAPRNCAGGFLLLAGVLLISFRLKGARSSAASALSPAIKPFISYWIFTAIYYLVLKCLLTSVDEWHLYVWTSLGTLVTALPMLMNTSVRGEVTGFFRNGMPAISVLLYEETFMFLGMIFSLFAYGLGSVALVSSIGALQPILTMLLVLVLGLFLPGAIKEEVDRNSLVQKSLSFAAVVAGIYLIC